MIHQPVLSAPEHRPIQRPTQERVLGDRATNPVNPTNQRPSKRTLNRLRLRTKHRIAHRPSSPWATRNLHLTRDKTVPTCISERHAAHAQW